MIEDKADGIASVMEDQTSRKAAERLRALIVKTLDSVQPGRTVLLQKPYQTTVTSYPAQPGKAAPKRERLSHVVQYISLLQQQFALLLELYPCSLKRISRGLLYNYVEIRKSHLISPAYEDWLQGAPWTLCYYGEPRCGKSCFAAAVQRDLSQRTAAIESSAVLTLFLGHMDRSKLTLRYLLGAMLRQLIESVIARGEKVATLQDLAAAKDTEDGLNADVILDCILKELSCLSVAFLIVDGLDHIDEEQQYHEIEHVLVDRLRPDAPQRRSTLRIMFVQNRRAIVSTRKFKCDGPCGNKFFAPYWSCNPCGQSAFDRFALCWSCHLQGHHCHDSNHRLTEPSKTLQISLHPKSLAVYIKDRLAQLEQQITSDEPSKEWQTVGNTIEGKARECFIIAKAYLDGIQLRQSFDQILNRLERVSLDERHYFASMMYEVTSQSSEEDRRLALAALALVAETATVNIAMSLEEVIAGTLLAANLRHATLDEYRFFRITKGFLTLRGPSEPETIHLFHYNANVYLDEECRKDFALLGLDIADLCLRSIMASMEDIANIGEDIDSFHQFLEQNPFIRFSIKHWGALLARFRTNNAISTACRLLEVSYQEINRLCRLTFLTINNFLEISDFRDTYLWSGTRAIHLIARFQLAGLMDQLMPAATADDIDIRQSGTGMTALQLSCMRNDIGMAMRLLKRGASLSQADFRGHTAIWYAVEIEEVQLVQKLLDAVGDGQRQDALKLRNRFDGGRTVLMRAVANESYNMVKLLLIYANDDIMAIKDDLGQTVLHIAASCHCNKELRLLTDWCTEKGASHQHFKMQDNAGRTPAMARLARSNDDNDIDDNKDESEGAAEVMRLIQVSFDPEHYLATRDEEGRTLLHYAVSNVGYQSIVDFLLSQGCDPNAQDSLGDTPLHVAVQKKIEFSNLQSLVNITDLNIRNSGGLTVYDVAQAMKYSEADALRPEHLSEEDVASSKRPAALWYAVASKMAEVTVEVLEQHLITLSDDIVRRQRDSSGHSLLHYAVMAGNVAIVEKLLDDSRVDPNARNLAGNTPLHLAFDSIEQGNSDPDQESALADLVVLLLNHDLDFDIENNEGHTYLSRANNGLGGVEDALSQRYARPFDLTLFLVNKSNSIRLKHTAQQKLLKRAIEGDDLDAVRKLSDHGASVFLYREANKLPSQTSAESGRSAEMQALIRKIECNVFDCYM